MAVFFLYKQNFYETPLKIFTLPGYNNFQQIKRNIKIFTVYLALSQ